MSRPSTTPYPALSMAMHWLMALWLVAVVALIELRTFYPDGSDIRNAMKSWHFILGLAVLAWVGVRMALRIGHRAPPISPPIPRWQERLGQVVHVLLYLLMIGLPLVGWLLLSAKGRPVPFFFGLQLPPLIGQNKPLAHSLKEIHEIGANLGYGLLAVHAGAALFHHWVQQDNTLLRMLPGRRP